MPTRRSMLKWIPAACFAGWCGLRPAAAAVPAAPAQAPPPSSDKEISCDYDSSHLADSDSSAGTYTCTYYDSHGRIVSVIDSDCKITYYEYPALADAT
jgi:YD repeat-containing protein